MDNNLIEINSQQELSPASSSDLVSIADNILLDVRTDITQLNTLSLPISQLATLGTGISSLLPAFRTVTETTSVAGQGLYRLANKAVNDTLKVAKDGNFWGALKTSSGASKMAKFAEAGDITTMSKTVMPIDPATIMMSVALFSIEQQLGHIEEMQRKIISFLEIEKESEIEADVETLSNIINKYKHSWDNEHFISSNHQTIIDIQRTSRKNMLSYQKKVKDMIKSKQIITLQSKVKNTLNELQKNFKYYRLSLFAFSMSSLLEIMLSGNFKEENILSIKEEIEKQAFAYRDIYGDCSVYLENMEKAALEANLLKGVGKVSKATGKLISNIPVVKDGQVDEFLQESGERVSDKATLIEKEVIETFAEMSNPGTNLFTEKMEDLIQIYVHTTDIMFDNKNIYLIAN